MDFILEYDQKDPTRVTNLSLTATVMTFLSSPIIKTIGKSACSKENVERVNMENTQISTIEYSAFAYCNRLTEIIFPETLKSIFSNAFLHSSLTTIKIPNSVLDLDGSPWNQITTIQQFIVNEYHPQLSVEKGCLFNRDKTQLIRATNQITTTDEIPNFGSIQCINSFALTNVPISSFIAEKALSSLESYSFHAIQTLKFLDLSCAQISSIPTQCIWNSYHIKTIKLPIILNEISESAIDTISDLTTIIIYQNVHTISENALDNCMSLKHVVFYGVNDFSSTKIFSEEMKVNLIEVYATHFYQYGSFGNIKVRYLHCQTCNNNNFIKSYSLLRLFITISLA